MSDHIFDLLGAYLDCELYGGQLLKVEAHLKDCLTCQEELRSLQALTVVLSEVPLPDFPRPERFTTDVSLRLPRKPLTPLRRQAVEIGWWLAPVGLILMWIFIGTVILVSNMVLTADEFGLLNNASAWLVSSTSGGIIYSAFLGQFDLLDNSSLLWLARSESFTRSVVLNIFWQVSIAMLYLSWIAIWWAQHTHRGLSQPIDSGTVPEGGSGPTVM